MDSLAAIKLLSFYVSKTQQLLVQFQEEVYVYV